MSTEQTLTPELDPGPVPLGTRIRNLLAIPGRLLGVLVVPDRVMPNAVREQRSTSAILAILVCALLSAYVVGARIDVSSTVLHEEAMRQKNMGADFEGKSDRELREDITKGRTIEQVKLGLNAGLLQPLKIFGLTIVLFLLGRFIGGRTTFGGSLAAAAYGSLPGAVKSLVVAAMAWPSQTLTPKDIETLNSISIPIPIDSLGLFRFLVDPFWLWQIVIVAFGLAAAAQVSRRRAFIAYFVLVASAMLLLTGLTGMSGAGPGHMTPPGGSR